MTHSSTSSFSTAADFSYGAGNGSADPVYDMARLRLSVSVFADRARLRDEMSEDAQGAGFRVAEAGGLDRLLAEEGRALGDVVLLDCPQIDGETMAGLARLDMRAARGGAQLVVSTSVDALDEVFGCLDQSAPQILVAPSRAERLIALGQVMTRMPQRRVRELSEEDRLVLLRLTEQV
ncbi:MAG TPA: MarR family transcriptional regulator, partial [Novosphingobium sp.]|nr:MarR family transcriptional regulator [Novosphingobium sp.]